VMPLSGKFRLVDWPVICCSVAVYVIIIIIIVIIKR